MARTGVQYVDVQRAIDALLQQGETPSVQKVRERLGTGSFTTISDHLRQWREQRAQNQDVPAPVSMPESVQDMAHALWNQAQQEAAEGLSHYREEADQRVAQANDEIAHANRQTEDALQRERAISEHMAHLQARLDERSSLLARAEAERDSLAAKEAQWQERVNRLSEQLQQLQARNEQSNSEHQHALRELQAQQQQQLNQEEQRHEAAESRLMTLLDAARQERQAAEKQHARREAQWEKRLSEREQEVQSLRQKLNDEERNRLEQARQTQANHDRAQALQHELDRRHDELAEASRTITRLREQLEQTEARLDRIQLPPLVY
ncbi:DNA-binding protein [Litchfieldella xinjiangensis]|uniref:DNA-binding protein n=1 Tax=Litchfieldella xinjiangensis TaxID=1166948 RepID=UPI000693F588|nr:DNA-binding protein [Halomonas xinjiangensis]